jgi:hypothetical protein
MKVYKVGIYDSTESGGEHRCYEYYSNEKDAKKAARTNDKEIIETHGLDGLITVRELEFSKDGILYYLNRYCGYPDNG